MRWVARRLHAAAQKTRGMPQVRRRAARLQAVRVVQRGCRETLSRADRGGSEGQRARQLLRLLQAAAGRVLDGGDDRGRPFEVAARCAVRWWQSSSTRRGQSEG